MRPVLVLSAALTLVLGACETTKTAKPTESAASAQTMTMKSAKLNLSKPMTRIGFGSCLKEKQEMTIWPLIGEEDPDLFVFLGDNVYGDAYPNDPLFDDPAMPKMVGAYEELATRNEFTEFRADTPMMYAWDDHDYGKNDGGAEYKFKDKAKELFLQAWDIPADDPRRSREGLYMSKIVGPQGQSVQMILLDTRFFRGPLKKTDTYNEKGKERYVPSYDSSSTMLGKAQWAWLADELKKPADLRILVSSIQVLADGHGWEAWKMLPLERNKLYRTLREAGANNTIVISGDRHAGAIYKRDDVAGFPLYEMTTSSLNMPVSAWKKPEDTYVEPGPYRMTAMQDEINYGMVDIDWDNKTATLRLVSPGNDTWTQDVEF